MVPEEQLAADYRHLLEEHRKLKEDYEQLNLMFENMGLGYEEALNLYDKAMESSRMKTDFIQQISHEIRTPLNILSGFAQVLTSGMELDDALRHDVTQGIAHNVQRITSLVNKMLELADAGSHDEIPRQDDVLAVQIAVQAVDESRISLASHLHFSMEFSPEAEAAVLCTNLQQAARALVLLLDNARKFTAPPEAAGGSAAAKDEAQVRLSVALTSQQAEPLRQSEQTQQAGEAMLVFTVEDTGVGVPPEAAERIFDEFVQLNDYYDGTGIGLTVARNIVRRLGGDIVLDTTYTNGARFVMTLPL